MLFKNESKAKTKQLNATQKKSENRGSVYVGRGAFFIRHPGMGYIKCLDQPTKIFRMCDFFLS